MQPRTNAETRLSRDEVAAIKGMCRRGDRQQDIAYYFGIPQSAVNEIKKGRRVWTREIPAATEGLPAPGPYTLVAKTKYDDMKTKAAGLQIAINTLEQLLTDLRGAQNDQQAYGHSRTLQALHACTSGGNLPGQQSREDH